MKKKFGKKRYDIMQFDYHTALWDKQKKKRVDKLLPTAVRESGIYKPTQAWVDFKKLHGKTDFRFLAGHGFKL